MGVEEVLPRAARDHDGERDQEVACVHGRHHRSGRADLNIARGRGVQAPSVSWRSEMCPLKSYSSSRKNRLRKRGARSPMRPFMWSETLASTLVPPWSGTAFQTAEYPIGPCILTVRSSGTSSSCMSNLRPPHSSMMWTWLPSLESTVRFDGFLV